jgi:hypothetical protein
MFAWKFLEKAMKRLVELIAMLLCTIGVANFATAGTDISGLVVLVQQRPDGVLLFRIDNAAADAYCKKGWDSTNFYVPANDPNYAYYYGILMNAVSKQKTVLIANVSFFNGTTACDVTKTGYGIVILG